MSIKKLSHTFLSIPTGGEVIILNTGSVIDSEAEAMLQALHSRSIGGLRNHLEVLSEKGADNFMANFYVGYGHKSIGDCGTTTIFVEGVSMLAAKAIQDWPLYSGQEASTRYIDFQTQPFFDPTDSPTGKEILETWRDFYTKSLPAVQAHVSKQYPKKESEKESIYIKAVAARAFDILRGFLPAGATTNLAWHTNLRQAADKLATLRHHPLNEVRSIALTIEQALQKAHPNSFHHKQYPETEEYLAKTMTEYYFSPDYQITELSLTNNSIQKKLLSQSLLATRPQKTELPKHLAEAGTLQFEFPLDFGSYRDLQRHRAVTQRMPLLTEDIGFHSWYFDQLPAPIKKEAEELLEKQSLSLLKLHLSPEEKQYFLPMGYQVANRVTGPLPAWVYLVELRATRFVHPTLSNLAQQIAKILEQEFSDCGLVLHLDNEPNRFDTKRGNHDIQIKSE